MPSRVAARRSSGASSQPLTAAASAAFNVIPGAASKLAFATPPSTTGAGATISPAVLTGLQADQTVPKNLLGSVSLPDRLRPFADQFIELRRPSIRKNSTNLYSLSNLKTAVQAMLLGNTRLGAADAQRRLTEKLDGADYDRLRDLVVNYFSRLSEEVPCFREILADPDSTDFVRVRDEYMCLNSVGLAVMGMVGHEAVLVR